MAGIYIHIPFCRQACHYCDFHFSTNQSYIRDMVDSMVTEIQNRSAFLQNAPVDTVYFGGGTPSLLPVTDIQHLLDAVAMNFSLRENAEITLEGNPDDLTATRLCDLHAVGVNRLSIGIQTFDDTLLSFLNRAHNSIQGLECIDMARKAGFLNISTDLIYSIPGENENRLEQDLAKMLSFTPEHISTYCLTIEQGTAFGHWKKTGRLKPVEEAVAADDYITIMERLTNHGYDHYEISNFAQPGFHSIHNTSYWQGIPYVGIGPGAHSYDGHHRQFNISHNQKYMKGIKENAPVFEVDELTPVDRINEYILISLRTKWGVNLNILKNTFGFEFDFKTEEYLNRLRREGLLSTTPHLLQLTRQGKLLADQIAEDLFILPEG